MKSSILTIFLSLILGMTLVHGATVNVGAGENLQTAIDNASAGDVLNLTAPVSYNGDLNLYSGFDFCTDSCRDGPDFAHCHILITNHRNII